MNYILKIHHFILSLYDKTNTLKNIAHKNRIKLNVIFKIVSNCFYISTLKFVLFFKLYISNLYKFFNFLIDL